MIDTQELSKRLTYLQNEILKLRMQGHTLAHISQTLQIHLSKTKRESAIIKKTIEKQKEERTEEEEGRLRYGKTTAKSHTTHFAADPVEREVLEKS